MLSSQEGKSCIINANAAYVYSSCVPWFNGVGMTKTFKNADEGDFACSETFSHAIKNLHSGRQLVPITHTFCDECPFWRVFKTSLLSVYQKIDNLAPSSARFWSPCWSFRVSSCAWSIHPLQPTNTWHFRSFWVTFVFVVPPVEVLIPSLVSCVCPLPGVCKLSERFGEGRWMKNSTDCQTRWWFQTFFIFTLTWGNDPIWLIFFKWIETTN